MNLKIELTSVIQALTVAERLSFRRAAEALGVCQSKRPSDELLGSPAQACQQGILGASLAAIVFFDILSLFCAWPRGNRFMAIKIIRQETSQLASPYSALGCNRINVFVILCNHAPCMRCEI